MHPQDVGTRRQERLNRRQIYDALGCPYIPGNRLAHPEQPRLAGPAEASSLTTQVLDLLAAEWILALSEDLDPTLPA
jgi:hypothetical protein